MISLTSDQNFVDVLEEIASTRGWQGEAVELHVQDPISGEEYRLNSGISPISLSNLTGQIIKNQNGDTQLLLQMLNSHLSINFLRPLIRLVFTLIDSRLEAWDLITVPEIDKSVFNCFDRSNERTNEGMINNMMGYILNEQ
jgi:hypothetical protein